MIFSYFETLVFEVAIATRLRTEIFALKKTKMHPKARRDRAGSPRIRPTILGEVSTQISFMLFEVRSCEKIRRLCIAHFFSALSVEQISRFSTVAVSQF